MTPDLPVAHLLPRRLTRWALAVLWAAVALWPDETEGQR